MRHAVLQPAPTAGVVCFRHLVCSCGAVANGSPTAPPSRSATVVASAAAPAPATPSRKARILCLHGYAQNADFFRARTGSVRKAIKSVAEFTFVDAPFDATGEFLKDTDADERGSMLGWFNAEEGSRPAISRKYRGVAESLALVRKTLADDGPFDGILGFSQGATLASLLCGMPPGPPPSMRFAILVSAFVPRDPAWVLADDAICALPTLHVMGESDALVPLESSRTVAARFSAGREHVHAGGHGVPSDKEFRALLKEFVASAMCD